MAVVGTALDPQYTSPPEAHAYADLKDRDAYVQKFKNSFNIAVNTENGYDLQYNSTQLLIVKKGFGSNATVYTCTGDNKKVKDAYLQFLLSDCEVMQFLKVIAENGGEAPRAWWMQTPPQY